MMLPFCRKAILRMDNKKKKKKEKGVELQETDFMVSTKILFSISFNMGHGIRSKSENLDVQKQTNCVKFGGSLQLRLLPVGIYGQSLHQLRLEQSPGSWYNVENV